MKNKYLLLLFVIIAILKVAIGDDLYALEAAKLYGKKSRYLKKVDKILNKRIQVVIPKSHYILKTDLQFKIRYSRPKATYYPAMNLGKLGNSGNIIDHVVEKKRIVYPNFYDNIKKLYIDIYIDDSLSRHLITDIQKIVFNLVPDLDDSRIMLSFSQMVIVSKDPMSQLELKLNNLKNWFMRNKIAMGFLVIIMAMIVFFLSINGLLNKAVRSISQVGNMLGKFADRGLDLLELDHKEFFNTIKRPNVGPAGAESSLQMLKSSEQLSKEKLENELNVLRHGKALILKKELSQFFGLCKARPLKMAYIIKKWIYSDDIGSSAALSLLPEIIDKDLFMEVIDLLGDDEKNIWLEKIPHNLDHNDIVMGFKFLKARALSEIFSDNEIDADKVEQEKVLISLSNSEIIDAIRIAPEIGGILLKGRPEAQVKALFARLPKHLISELIELSLQSNEIDIEKNFSKIKDVLSQVRSKKVKAMPPSFMDHIITQLQTVGPTREKEILKMFRDNDRMEMLDYVSRKVFPSELIFSLPLDTLKLVINAVPFNLRVQLAWISNESQLNKILNCLGGPESREREFVEIEYNKIKEYPLKAAKIDATKEAIWGEFANISRKVLASDEKLQSTSKFILDEWIYSIEQTDNISNIKKAS